MPTVIVLDVSLSMCRPVPVPDSTEEFQRKNLAIHGINSLLDYMSVHCKLEFTSLIVFSYLWEQLVTFTRDFDAIKSALNKVETYNKTCIEAALTGVGSIITDEWNSVTPSQVILITDGSVGYGQKSLKQSLETWDQRDPTVVEDKFPLPFRFPSNLHVVVIGNPNDADVKTAIPLYEKLIEINGQGGELFLPDSNLSLKSVQTMFTRLAEKYYKPYTGTLQCGHFKCPVQLFPPPEKYDNLHEFEHVKNEVSNSLEIMGFIEIGDAASPQTLSRHLVLPLPSKESKSSLDSTEKKDKEEEEEALVDDGKTPAFTVLLHGSLKVEGMVALTKLAEDWFGILYSWADSKKKSNLMLSILQPGPEPISWLGNIHNLAPISDFTEPPYGEDDNKTPFPIRPQDKRSYAQSCVVWIKPMGLQTDIQKVLRHARKLPDKLQQFYKELNRLRRAALSFGFHELLGAMATMLERECRMLPGTALVHPDGSRARVWTQVLDMKDGSYVIRFRLFQSYTELHINVLHNGKHLAKSPYRLNNMVYHEKCYCPLSSLEKWYTVMDCPDSYLQIENDLAQFKDVDVEDVAKEAISRFNKAGMHSLSHYRIIDNKVYRKTYGEHVGFKMFSDAILLSLTRKVKLPDIEIFVNLGDWPLEKKSQGHIPIFSWCGSDDTKDIVMPTYDITEATLEMMSRVTLDTLSVQANTGPEWENKTEKAFWRGRDSRQERLDLVVMSREQPELIDAALTHMFFFPKDPNKYGELVKSMPFFDFFKYKYQINLDGTVAAYRLPYLLGGNSVVLKQDSNYYEHFYKMLQPFEHYVPFKRDLSDLKEKIEWAKKHDAEAKKIGQNAQRFVKENLMPKDIFCYHVKVFEKFSKKLKRPPAKPDSSWELVDQPHDDDSKCDCKRLKTLKKHDEL